MRFEYIHRISNVVLTTEMRKEREKKEKEKKTQDECSRYMRADFLFLFASLFLIPPPLIKLEFDILNFHGTMI
jgi:hypothetical protein